MTKNDSSVDGVKRSPDCCGCLTKAEFCKKWRNGWREMYTDGSAAYFYTEEQMLNDLNSVIYSEVCNWKKFVDTVVESSVNLDEWQRLEAEAIKNRK